MHPLRLPPLIQIKCKRLGAHNLNSRKHARESRPDVIHPTGSCFLLRHRVGLRLSLHRHTTRYLRLDRSIAPTFLQRNSVSV